MKRAMMITCAVFILLLSGCSVRQHRHMQTMHSAEAYVLENEERIRDASEWLITHYSHQGDLSEIETIHIERNAKNEIDAENYTSQQMELIHNDACEALLVNDGFFKSITLHKIEDCYTVEFNIKGIGNNAYFDVVYVPSGNVEDVWFFDSRFSYTEADGGFLGTQVDGDNSFFYLPLSDHLFYCEAYF